jgi:hypothetical protein
VCLLACGIYPLPLACWTLSLRDLSFSSHKTPT